ncbi:MAG: carbon-nitrogen hydrolase family protein [Granulosicoccus sp.]
MKIVACQVPDIRNNLTEALSVIYKMTSLAESEYADIALFPECFLQGYFTDHDNVARLAISLESDEFDVILAELSDFHCTIVFGLIEKTEQNFHNTAVVIRSGELICRYRKTQLLEGEKAVFSAGEDYPLFEVMGQGVGINICNDLNYRSAVEAIANQSAKIVVCPCNNMMPFVKAEKYKELHHQIRCKQAQDVGVWIISSDVMGVRGGRISYGPTSAISPQGIVVKQVPLETTGQLVIDVE